MFRIRSIGLVTILAAIFGAVPNAHCADNTFTDNGKFAKALEEKVEAAILNNEINSMGFSLYLRGVKYSNDAQATVSSNPRQEFVDRHLAGYCTAQFDTEMKAGCVPGSLSPEDQKYLELGDIKASVLLSPDKYSEVTSLMAQNLIRTLLNPFPTDEVRRAIQDQALDGKKDVYAEQLAVQAARGVPLFSFNEMFAMRATGTELGAGDGSETYSIMSVMENEFTRRFYNKADLEDILNDGGTDELRVLKEMARMQAADLWLKYLSFRQSERIEALLATGVAQSINSAQDTKASMSSATRGRR